MARIPDDKSRFITILELLPEKFVDNFVCDYLYNAYYPTEFNKTLQEYSEHKKEILSEFANPKINESYTNLNKSFDALKKYLISHFSKPKQHYEMYKEPPFFYLEPRIHHNFAEGDDISEKSSQLWDEYANTLDKLADDFRKAYKDLVKIAKKEIEQKETIKNKWWEKTWMQMIMLLGAIAGIIGLYFLLK